MRGWNVSVFLFCQTPLWIGFNTTTHFYNRYMDVVAGTCESCPANRYGTLVGAESSAECTACPEFSDTGGQEASYEVEQCNCPEFSARDDTDTVCECSAGMYMLQDGANTPRCEDCAIGRYRIEVGARSVTECLACPLYASTQNTRSALFEDCICPALSQLDANNVECQCQAGYYMEPLTNECTACPRGRFRPDVGGVSFTSCKYMKYMCCKIVFELSFRNIRVTHDTQLSSSASAQHKKCISS